LRFCINLVDHPLQDNEYKNAIISGLAVLGIRDDEGWLDAQDYTPKYLAVIKLARLMVGGPGRVRAEGGGHKGITAANEHPGAGD
jgi:hypothetical protein